MAYLVKTAEQADKDADSILEWLCRSTPDNTDFADTLHFGKPLHRLPNSRFVVLWHLRIPIEMVWVLHIRHGRRKSLSER